MTPTVRLLASGGIVLCFMVGADELELENISLLLSYLCKRLRFNTDCKPWVVPLAKRCVG